MKLVGLTTRFDSIHFTCKINFLNSNYKSNIVKGAVIFFLFPNTNFIKFCLWAFDSPCSIEIEELPAIFGATRLQILAVEKQRLKKIMYSRFTPQMTRIIKLIMPLILKNFVIVRLESKTLFFIFIDSENFVL